VKAFQHYESTTLVCGWYQLIDDTGKELQLRRLKADRTIVSSRGGGAPPILMSTRNPIGPLTTSMFPRQALPLGLGPWFFHTGAPDSYFGLIDMTIILDLAFQGRVVMLAEPLSSMRMHDEQLSNPGKNLRLIHTIKSWLPLVDDAHAYGLISDVQYFKALESVLMQFRRFLRMFPALEEDIDRLRERLLRVRRQETENANSASTRN
jgi:hypothetical protein